VLDLLADVSEHVVSLFWVEVVKEKRFFYHFDLENGTEKVFRNVGQHITRQKKSL
jgi:hypothetical protein